MQKYTLKELTEIGSKAAIDLYGSGREYFTKAILDAIGYELPKDEEREAFDAWWKDNCIAYCNEDHAFQVWKSAREELRKAQSLDKQPNEPAWIPWNGGECPIPDTVKRWQYKSRDGFIMDRPGYEPQSYEWNHDGKFDNIIAYRVWE